MAQSHQGTDVDGLASSFGLGYDVSLRPHCFDQPALLGFQLGPFCFYGLARSLDVLCFIERDRRVDKCEEVEACQRRIWQYLRDMWSLLWSLWSLWSW